MEGGCACGNIRYHLTGTPMITHACHCTWCQRETGTVHALKPEIRWETPKIAKAFAEPPHKASA